MEGMEFLYGPDRMDGFCGNPYDEDGFGIYAGGLQALERVAGDRYKFRMKQERRYLNF